LASRWTVAAKRARRAASSAAGRVAARRSRSTASRSDRSALTADRVAASVTALARSWRRNRSRSFLEAPQAAGVAGARPGRQRVDRPRPAGHGLAHHPPGERHGRFQVGGGQVVGLVEHHEQAHRVLGDAFQEGALGLGDGWVGGGDQHGRVQTGQVGVGRQGVVVKDRPDPWGVDQPHAVVQQRRVQPGGHPGHPEGVGGVGLLSDEAGDPVQGVLLTAAVGVLDQQPLVAAFQHGRHGCQREHPDRQHLAAQQRVDQAGLAALELADHRDLKHQRRQPAGGLGGLLGDLGGAQPVGYLA
jgi:hypothetical protein